MDKVIVIVGPTGVGKTKQSIAIAKACNGEIISGDAYQCYQEMSIGSAKIKQSEKEGIPHHLIDFISYKETYNVKMFQEEARKCIKDIIARGKTPIICGGTGLYIKALLYDYVFEEEHIDEEYLKHLETKDNETLYTMLQTIDETACENIHQNNRKRILRALMMAHQGSKKSDRLKQQTHTLLYDAYIVGLTMERTLLYERIDARVLEMIKEGLESEIFSIVKSVDDFKLQSMQGIGYKEWLMYYQKDMNLDDTIALIQKNSRNFAKRQFTWFNNQMDVHWYDVCQKESDEKIKADVISFLGDRNAR